MIVAEVDNTSVHYRISWGAALAGCVLSLVTCLALSTFLTAIGMSSLDFHQPRPLEGIGTGAIVGVLLSTLASVFVGAYVAGLLAASRGALHGLLSWAVTTLLAAWVMAALAGSTLSATSGVIGKGVSLAGSGVAAAAPAAVQGIEDQLAQRGVQVNWKDLRGELDTLLRQSGKPQLQPEALEDRAKVLGQQARQDAGEAAVDPGRADDDLDAWFKRLRLQAKPTVAEADQEALVNIIAARTGKSHAEARKIADNYMHAYDQAVARYEELKRATGQKLRQAGDTTARSIARAAWVALAAMIAGALVAAAAGAIGGRRGRIVTTVA